MTETTSVENTTQVEPTQEGTKQEAPRNYLEEIDRLRADFIAKNPQGTPTEPIKEEPKPEELPQEDVPQNYDSPLDFTIQLVTSQTGLTEDKLVGALENALAYNDPKLINLGELTKGLKSDQAQQVTYLVNQMYTEATERTANDQKQAYELAGGKDQWVTAVGAFNTKAGKAVQVQAKALADSGYTQEAVKLVLSTVLELGLVQHKEQPSLQGAGKSAPTQYLTAQEFRSGTQALMKEYGVNFLSIREARAKYDALAAQYQTNKG